MWDVDTFVLPVAASAAAVAAPLPSPRAARRRRLRLGLRSFLRARCQYIIGKCHRQLKKKQPF